MSDMRITSIQEIVAASSGVVVELPNFASGKPFVAKLKQPSMFALASSGKIPNSLLGSVDKLFGANSIGSNADDAESTKRLVKLMEIVCEASFVEPTWKELKDNNIELTDEQMLFVFQFAQQGTKALAPFRK